MTSGSNPLNFYLMPTGNVLDAQLELIERLKRGLNLQEVSSEEKCDFIIAFVTIVSRAGTDIDAAVQTIPASRPVVLAVFHHTFDENYIAPQSKWSVNRENVFTMDFLFHEDTGLLGGQRNDDSLKSLTNYLTSLGDSSRVLPHPTRCCRSGSPWMIAFFTLFVLVVILAITVIILNVLGELQIRIILSRP